MAEPRRDKAPAPRNKPKPRGLAVGSMTPMERQLYERYGLEPGIRRPGLVPLAVNPRSGKIELTAPQFVYDAIRAFEAPGMILSGAPVDMEEEAQNFGLTFTGAGLGAGMAAKPAKGAVLGMSGGRRGAKPPKPLAAKPKSPKAPPAKQPKPSAPKPLAVKPRTKYQPVEPVAEPHPELAEVMFPEGSGRGGSFAIERNVPIVGRRPFIAQSPSGYSSLAGGIPANRVSVEATPFVDMPERQFLDPHDLVKEARSIVPLIGDKLRGGEDILSVAGRAQEGAARAYSGPDFPRQQIAAGGREVWGSGPSVITAIDRMALDAQNRFGGPVAGVYTAMGPEAVDQTTAMMNLIGRQIAAGGVSPRDLGAFDDALRTTARKGDEPIPDFVGFAKDPMAAIEQLNDIGNITMGQRRTLTQLMNAKPWLEAGFPDIGANRAGLTIPELLYAPEGTSGYMISMLEPGKGALPDEMVSMRHPNYAKKLGGAYLGGFEVGVPRELVWSQLYGRPEIQRYEPFRQLGYLFGRPPKEVRADIGYDPRIQPIDEEWADRIAEYINNVKNYGVEPYAGGGLAVRKARKSFAAKKG